MTSILRRFSVIGLLLGMIAASARAQSGQPASAAEAYGQGVHAYFAGRYADAQSHLSAAAASATNDPRPFYFRAMSLMRLGRADEALADIETGAAIEAKLPNRYAVGSALQRVQGSDRLILERYRRQARSAAIANYRSNRTRIGRQAHDDAQVLRQQVVVPLDEFSSESDPRSLTAEELQQRAAAAAARAAAARPAEAVPPATPPADPFNDDVAAEDESAMEPAGDASADESLADEPPPGDDAEDADPEMEASPDSEPAAESEEPADSTPPAGSDEDPFGDL